LADGERPEATVADVREGPQRAVRGGQPPVDGHRVSLGRERQVMRKDNGRWP